jgi:hypothetical protein
MQLVVENFSKNYGRKVQALRSVKLTLGPGVRGGQRRSYHRYALLYFALSAGLLAPAFFGRARQLRSN